MNEKLILDIRYYESSGKFPGYLGRRYFFSIDAESAGARIARKLRELGLKLGIYDHIYLVFTDKLSENQIDQWDHIIDPRIRCFDYGASPLAIAKLSVENQLRFVQDAAFRTIQGLVCGDTYKTQLIQRVIDDISNFKTELEIIHKKKSTSSYSINISYQIKPNEGLSTAWIQYEDKKDNWSCKKPFIELEFYQDIYFLISTITVSNGMIHLKPRDSFKSEINTKRYSVPIEISIEKLKTGQLEIQHPKNING